MASSTFGAAKASKTPPLRVSSTTCQPPRSADCRSASCCLLAPMAVAGRQMGVDAARSITGSCRGPHSRSSATASLSQRTNPMCELLFRNATGHAPSRSQRDHQSHVRSAGKRIRVSAQLIDAPSRSHLWAQRYDRELEDLFALQDEITEAIVGALEPELGAAERERARHKPPHNLDAWSCYQRGLGKSTDTNGPTCPKRSVCSNGRLNSIPTLDAPMPASRWRFHQRLPRLHRRSGIGARSGSSSSQRSVALDERDALAHWTLGRALLRMREHDEAIAEFETAIDLSPSFAQADSGLGWALAYSQRPEEALSEIDKAYRLSPRDPLLFGITDLRDRAHDAETLRRGGAVGADRAAGNPIRISRSRGAGCGPRPCRPNRRGQTRGRWAAAPPPGLLAYARRFDGSIHIPNRRREWVFGRRRVLMSESGQVLPSRPLRRHVCC